MGAAWNNESWRIIRGMSPIELVMLEDRGFPLPPDLKAKADEWRAMRAVSHGGDEERRLSRQTIRLREKVA